MKDINLNTYNSPSVVKWYEQLNELTPAEAVIFRLHEQLLKNSTLLDIGIGAGRTTVHLEGKCKHYTGIDYSAEFIKVAKIRFPSSLLLQADARDLSVFPSNTFDVVNFSLNGMDYADLDGREKILSEISRVLKPKGLFFFCTHNRNHPSFNISPWKDKSLHLFTRIKTGIQFFPFLLRKLKNKKHEFITNEYAIINDSAHNYSLMTFYTSPGFLLRQLHKNKFEMPVFYGRSGEKTSPERSDDWIFVTCTKTNV